MADVPKIALKPNRDILLDAIRDVETSAPSLGGLRFEPAWMPRGVAFGVQGRVLVGSGACMSALARLRWARWGVWTAASYGPWQMLWHTAADLGFTGPPWELLTPSVAEAWAGKLLDRIVAQGAQTVEQVADAWNSGSFRDGIIPREYIAKVAAAYAARGGEV